MTDDSRIVVFVCAKCHKLIGTRENYYVILMKGKKTNLKLCDGCYNDCKQ
jgi:hypothetical protein